MCLCVLVRPGDWEPEILLTLHCLYTNDDDDDVVGGCPGIFLRNHSFSVTALSPSPIEFEFFSFAEYH